MKKPVLKRVLVIHSPHITDIVNCVLHGVLGTGGICHEPPPKPPLLWIPQEGNLLHVRVGAGLLGVSGMKGEREEGVDSWVLSRGLRMAI